MINWRNDDIRRYQPAFATDLPDSTIKSVAKMKGHPMMETRPLLSSGMRAAETCRIAADPFCGMLPSDMVAKITGSQARLDRCDLACVPGAPIETTPTTSAYPQVAAKGLPVIMQDPSKLAQEDMI